MALLQRMSAEWPFFRALLSNMDMVLAKADMHLAKRYAELVPDQELAEAVFASLEAGMAAHHQGAERDHRRHRRGSPTIRRWPPRSSHRFPYISPLNHLQVELLRRWRGGEQDDRDLAIHPHLDQRHRGGTAQHRLSGARATFRR